MTIRQAATGRAGSALEMLVVAAVAALVLGGVVGFLSRQEDQGNVVRTGTPWVAAAFAIGAIVGYRGRGSSARLAGSVASIAASMALVLASAIYYGVANPLFDQGARPWTVVGIGMGIVFGLAGATWGRSRATAPATVAVSAFGLRGRRADRLAGHR